MCGIGVRGGGRVGGVAVIWWQEGIPLVSTTEQTTALPTPPPQHLTHGRLEHYPLIAPFQHPEEDYLKVLFFVNFNLPTSLSLQYLLDSHSGSP